MGLLRADYMPHFDEDFMNKFRQLGFVEYHGGVKVHPSLPNVVLRD